MRRTDREHNSPAAQSAADPSVKRLTPREHDVARLVADGLKDVVIARRLGLSPATVKSYIQRVQHRLGLESRHEIATWITTRVTLDVSDRRLRRTNATH